MSKKNWISVKRGLSEDPKHRQALGEAIWLFLHIIDAADWETGIVYDWRDKEIAIDMSLSTATVRGWRDRLSDGGYIVCKQVQHGLEITIHNWVDPRNYSGKKMNVKQGDTAISPSKYDEIQDESQVDTQVDAQVLDGFTGKPSSLIESTPTSESESNKPSKPKIKLPEGSSMDWMIAAGAKPEDITNTLEIEKHTALIVGTFEQAMGYNPLGWTGQKWERLLKFLQTKTPEEIIAFANWCKQPFTQLSPAKARMYPELVIDLWPQVFPKPVTPTQPRKPGEGFYG